MKRAIFFGVVFLMAVLLLGCGEEAVYWQHVITDAETFPSGAIFGIHIYDNFFENECAYDVYWDVAGYWTSTDFYVTSGGDPVYWYSIGDGQLMTATTSDRVGDTIIVCKMKVHLP